MSQQNEQLRIGCIADDFTGGSDAASFLKRAGLRTLLLEGTSMSSEMLRNFRPEAVVVALKSRSIAANQAVAQSLEAAGWLLHLGAQQLYFKYCSTFDSTPAGNIGPVTDALLDLTGSRYTVLCPSLPVNGRTVRDGVLYVNGVPLAESSMRNHPINPMTRSNLTELMEAQSRYPCFWLTRQQMEERDPVADCPGKGRFTVVPPYENNEDGRQIAERFGRLPLLTGGSGLLEHLGRRFGKGTPAVEDPGCSESLPLPRLLLSGSCSAMTQRQVQVYLEHGGAALRLEPDKLLSGEQTEDMLLRAVAEARGDLLLYSTADPAQVSCYQRAGAQQVSSLLEGLMGRLAVCGRAHGYRRIVVAGGETSGAVAQALGLKAYRVGKDAAPGVPELWPIGQEGLGLVLKSGNFGEDQFFLTALKDSGGKC